MVVHFPRVSKLVCSYYFVKRPQNCWLVHDYIIRPLAIRIVDNAMTSINYIAIIYYCTCKYTVVDWLLLVLVLEKPRSLG